MNQLTDNIIQINFDDISKADLPYNESFGLITFINDVKYEFFMNLKENSQKLIVQASGAIPSNKPIDRTRPYLNRWSWCKDVKDSMICFNDPTNYINDDIYCGYGVGTKEDYYLEKIRDISLAIAENLGLKNDNILFYGSSAGGYTSLLLSTMVKGSTAICDIPQFYLNELWFNYWESFKKYIFINMDDDEIINKYGYRINAIEMMKKEKYIPNAILILDCSVERDFNMQYLHFLSDLSNLPFEGNANNIKIYITGQNKGHIPLNFSSSMFVLNESDMLGNNLSYDSLSNFDNHILECEQLRATNNSLRNANNSLKKEIKSLKKFKKDVLSSRSWKITKYLRLIGNKF
ncbi:hypothetical protein [Methanobrevibacter sp.]|uniref:hypothetical protein n=1 Tax=Methanobrevibacter sp. TaxID=66852 RepID=UPI0026E07F23|nr:hypothetical protein [Methanobrevibacter sp.]MDO5824424.1 hypothetical protein [Methanobrevibacter sp.]